MSAAASTARGGESWPGGRILAGWWPALARWQPRSLWLQHLLLHRVEALVNVSRGPVLERLNRLLLETLAANTLDRLGLEPGLVAQLLVELESARLVQRTPGSPWQLTPTGRAALGEPRAVCTTPERRVFYFTEGQTQHPGVRFLPLEAAPTQPWPDVEKWSFDIRLLNDCVAQAPEWKQRQCFPVEVTGLAGTPGDWRGVIVDRPEQLFVVLVLTPSGEWLGFPVQPSSWQLQAERPVLRLAKPLPELTAEPTLEEWRQAWRNWGQPRSLPVGELEACQLERVEARLRVCAPRPLVDRLRSARSDAIKGEAWLLAGTADRTRVAAQVELVET